MGTDSDVRRTLDERIREAMRRLSNDLDIDLEEDTGYFSKDIEYDEWDEFEDALPPTSKRYTNFRQTILVSFFYVINNCVSYN